MSSPTSSFTYGVSQACTTYGPRLPCGLSKLFLRPARAFSIEENVAKAYSADN